LTRNKVHRKTVSVSYGRKGSVKHSYSSN